MASNQRITPRRSPHEAHDLEPAGESCESEGTPFQTVLQGKYAKEEEMPQSTTGSVTQECHLRCIKDGSQFLILAVSGCQVVNGVVQAEMPKGMNHLVFCITDFDAYDGRYQVRASSAIGQNQTTLQSWSSPAPGEHWSPALHRDMQAPPEETKVVAMTIELQIDGPIVTGATTPPVNAGVVRPPTTVVIRSRLEDPDEAGV